ncbi:MAG: hypothetical protein HFH49_16500 [Lachnospiraceae bacterium]|nr:hypothetical protein [Lachnospiraceae bacterium]
MKKWKKVLLALLLVCLTAGQCVTAQAAKKSSPKYKVTMNKSVYTMKKGKSIQLKASKNKAAKKKKVVWTSSNKKVATVTSKGKVKAKKNGKATITAKLKGTKIKTTCKIVVGTPVTKIKLNKKSVELEEGGKAKLKVTVSPKKPTNKKVTYKSSKKSVVTVNSKGEIKAVKAGEAKITVTAADGTGKSASCKVTVKGKKVVTPPADPDIAVGSVALNETSVSLLPGETKKLSATVKPDNATNKTIAWRSSAPSVVTVGNDGTVKAVGEGIANVTASASNGKSAVCSVKVAYKGAVSNQLELNQALSSKMVSDIVYTSNASGEVVIPQGNYENKTLVINAPNADVTNNGSFKQVTVNAIARNTYVENSTNVVYFNAQTGRIVVGRSGSATINLNGGGNQQFTLENNGYVKDLNIPGRNTALNIKGTQYVNVTLGAGASGSSIVTETELRIAASVAWDMTILPGGEHTRADIANKSCLPSIWGLGCISVKIISDNDVINIPAEMKEGLGISQKVNVSGNVNEYNLKEIGSVVTPEEAERASDGTDSEKQALEEASVNTKIYLLPYTNENSGINIENYKAFIQGTEKTAVTDDAGSFAIGDVTVGNYWLIAEKDGYQANVKNVVITSNQAEGYACGTTVLLSNEIAECKPAPSITGTVRIGLTAQPVSAGFQVKLRKGAGNVLGEAFQVTQTKEDGTYEFANVPAGIYTVEVLDLRQNLSGTAERYNASSIDIVVAYPYLTSLPDCVVDEKMETITGQGRVQFTLTWGSEESGASADIDSHLVGPRADGDGEFHVYYSDRDYYVNGETMADLDVDDIDYEGPEHTTIYKETDGVYRFYIHNFSERNTENSEMLGKSSIRVRVTIGSNSYVYHCPNQKGNLWYVCDYDSRTHTIIPRNIVSNFMEDEGDIGLSEEELAARRLERKKSEAMSNASSAKRYLMKFSDNAAKSGIASQIAALESQVDSAADLNAVETLISSLQQIQEKLENSVVYFSLEAGNLVESPYRDTVNEYDEEYNLIGVRSVMRCSLTFGETLKEPVVKPYEGSTAELEELEAITEAGYSYVVHVTDNETGLVCDVWLQILGNQAQAELSNLAKRCSDYMGMFEENEEITADKAAVDSVVADLAQVTDEESYNTAKNSLNKIFYKYEDISDDTYIIAVAPEAEIDEWRQDPESIYDESGEEEIGKCDVLKLYLNEDVTAEEILAKLEVTFSSEDIVSEMTDSDIEGYSKLIKATRTNEEGTFVKKIYIKVLEW